MDKMDESRCGARVYPQERRGSFYGHQCQRKAWKDGFCKTHHPETVKARDAEREKKWREKEAKDPLNCALKRVKQLEARVKELEAENENLRVRYGKAN